jgi:DNA-binding MarR family transcriptional regulator
MGDRDPAQAEMAVEGLGDLSPAWMPDSPLRLVYRVTLLARCLERQLARFLHARAGMTVAEWRVLSAVNMRPRATVSSVAERWWVDPSEVSRAATILVGRGAVERRTNPADRRSTLLVCTAAGRALYEELIVKRDEFNAALLDRLDLDERASLDNALLILALNFLAYVDPDEARPGARADGIR